MSDIFLVFFFSYFSGSIPFGLILTKYFGGKDIRKIGSGNIGATNVLRTGKKILALSTLLLDGLKGYIPIIITQEYFPELVHLSCILVFIGHVFPVWLRFKGGKGVATFLGILFALSLQLSLLFIFTWVVVFLIFKYSSLSSLFSSLTVFVVTLIKEEALSILDSKNITDIDLKFILFTFFILIVYTHRKNIINLKNKTETKIKI
tara:strand:+ start:3733 stop:4347 length:615 start_codon:yes stop_codon:yes gene_type:complete